LETANLEVNVRVAVSGCRDFLDEDGEVRVATVIIAPVKFRSYLGEVLVSYACSRGRFCHQRCEYAFARTRVASER